MRRASGVERPRQDLQRHVAAEGRVVGPVDLAHTAAAKQRDHPQVRADGIARLQLRRQEGEARVEQRVRRGVGGEHRLDQRGQRLVAAAGVTDEAPAIARRPVERRFEDHPGPSERVGGRALSRFAHAPCTGLIHC